MNYKKKSKTSKVFSFNSFAKGFLKETFHIESSIVKTLQALILKPGHLTISYLKTSDSNYVQPLKLYFAVNLLFFLLIPILSTPQFRVFSYSIESLSANNNSYQKIIEEQIKSNNIPKIIYQERFNAHLKYNQSAFVFLVIPIFAGFLNIINFMSKRYYMEHLIYSIHYASFFLFSILAGILAYRILTSGLKFFINVDNAIVAKIILWGLLIWNLFYLFKASRSYSSEALISTIVKAPIYLVGFLLILGVYVQFLFFYTVVALKLGY